MNQDNFKKICSTLISFITVLAGLTAYAQADAGQHEQVAARDSRRYTLEAFGLKVRGHAQSNFAYYEAFNTYYELQSISAHAEKVGEETTSSIYSSVADELTKHSVVFKDYFNSEEGSVDILRFEADLYVREVARIEQSFNAASQVQAAWGDKATKHVVQLTLLAVALFLLGQASNLKGDFTKKLLFFTGLTLTCGTLTWALVVWSVTVPDLRTTGAIQHFANGVALDHRDLAKQATVEYDEAIKLAPKYLDAYVARGQGFLYQDKYTEASQDFEHAWKLKPGNPLVAANLSEAYYHQGRFADAIKFAKKAVALAPDHVDHRAKLALASLASGDSKTAVQEYEKTMAVATRIVAEAHAKKAQPPAFIWERLDEAAIALEDLWTAAEEGEGTPPKDKIQKHEEVIKACKDLHDKLDGLSISLEYTGKPPQGKLTAEFGDLGFGLPIYDDAGEVESEIQEFPDDKFPAGTREVVVEFPYGKVPDGQELVMRVYQDGAELPSWRLVEKWSIGDGDNETDYYYRILSPGYSKTAELEAGHYFVEFFMNAHLAAKGSFDIAEIE